MTLGADFLEHCFALLRVAALLLEQRPHIGDDLLALRIALSADRTPFRRHQRDQVFVTTCQQLLHLIHIERIGGHFLPPDRFQQRLSPSRPLRQQFDHLWL